MYEGSSRRLPGPSLKYKKRVPPHCEAGPSILPQKRRGKKKRKKPSDTLYGNPDYYRENKGQREEKTYKKKELNFHRGGGGVINCIIRN
jgi:hypothetical protein